jgi:hypothetical protein
MHVIDKVKHWFGVEEWEKIFQATGHRKPARVAIPISDKTHIKSKLMRMDKEVHFILIKGIN